jgi:hypothetical protein
MKPRNLLVRLSDILKVVDFYDEENTLAGSKRGKPEQGRHSAPSYRPRIKIRQPADRTGCEDIPAPSYYTSGFGYFNGFGLGNSK